jgi:hypothetical protein
MRSDFGGHGCVERIELFVAVEGDDNDAIAQFKLRMVA